MKYADLHLHTAFSDGTYTPEELVSEGLKTGLSAVAVTDHDTVYGIEPALEAGKKKDMEVLPGIELTVEDGGREVHLLGYLLDHKNKELINKLEVLKEYRVARIYKMVKKLEGLGLELDPKIVFDIAGNGTVGRLHLARAMVKEGLIGFTGEAFYRYIGDRGPAYVCGFRLPPVEAIRLIRGAGGIPVLAHPYTLGNDELIPKFVEYGLMGLEVYYPEHTRAMTKSYLELAEKYHLLVTGGSDCHGNAKPEVRIGSVSIPYELVTLLKEAKNRV
ncbi:MAG: PHP domain-containing protein [Candidatus Omnitrophota bacterium]|jgi:hypothetical protein